jgi:amidase
MPMTELWSRDATELTAGVRARRFSAREAAESALARIDAVNPTINAVVDRCDAEALAAADAIDAQIAKGWDPGPLGGVPVTVKVNVDQKGHATTNGLRRQRDLIAAEDNPVVASLRRAGAVIVGRTNTPAFSIRWFTRNSLHGATRNPAAPGHTPGGSSGGAAAAVAAGIGALGHGTDIAGSIRYPAYACGIHGLRPTVGRVAAINFTAPDRHLGGQVTAVSGPLGRSMADLRLALGAMAAPDARDPWWVPAPLDGPKVPRKVAFCPAPEGMPVASAVADALRAAADRLADAGYAVTEMAAPPLRRPAELQLKVWLSEMRRTGEDVVEKEGDADAIEIWRRLSDLTPAPDFAGFMDIWQERAGLVRAWRMFLEETPLLLCPVSGALPFPDHADLGGAEAFAQIAEAQLTQIGLPLIGCPALSVATGRAEGLPVGVQLVAGPFREDLLLEAGEVLAGAGAVPVVEPVA